MAMVNVALTESLERDVVEDLICRCGSFKKIVCVIAWVFCFIWKSNGNSQSPLCSEEIRATKIFLIKYIQKDLKKELEGKEADLRSFCQQRIRWGFGKLVQGCKILFRSLETQSCQ